jgi:PIN domain
VFHETYGYLGAEGVVSVIWSESILAELERVLRSKRRMPGYVAAVTGFVRAGFAGGRVESHPVLGAPYVVDHGDAYVAATAIAAGVDGIVTLNIRGFRADLLKEHGVVLLNPTDHLGALADAFPLETARALERQAAGNPRFESAADLLDLFAKRGFEQLASNLRRALNST